MGLLSGAVSVSRYNVTSCPEEPDFERARFTEIPTGSEVKERVGFVPFEPEAPYEVGARRFAFRVRIDKVRPDPTLVRERVKQLVRVELETTGTPYVGPKKRKQLRHLAEEEILPRTSPTSRIVEGVIDGGLLYVGTTASTHLGTVLLQLRQIGVVAEMKTPWVDGGEPEVMSDFVETREAGESVLGCRFLKALMGDPDLLVEPESGHVRLQTPDAKVTLTGAVLPELHRYVERGAEILAAKLTTPETSFKLDALSWRLSGLKVEAGRHDHWTQLLDERLERIGSVFELLDAKYAAHRQRRPAPAAESGESAGYTM